MTDKRTLDLARQWAADIDADRGIFIPGGRLSVDQYDLADMAKTLIGLYTELDKLKHEKVQPVRAERLTKPSFGPGDPGNTRIIDLEDQLTEERQQDDNQDEIPGGLFVMVRDAVNHTSNPQRTLTHHGSRLCMVVYRNAYEIAERFPAAGELLELMQAQVQYLTRHLDRRPTTVHDMQHRHQLDLSQAWGTAAELAPLASSHTGKPISRDLIRKWATRDKLGEIKLAADGSPRYNLQQVIDHANS